MSYNFTLIIPTHNRHNYLKRSIQYYKDLDAEVIYCDSSEKPYTEDVPIKMKYLHLPGKTFAEKIIIVLEEIENDYIALCADDDFILKKSLFDGIELLMNNHQYQTVLGKRIGFYEEFDGAFYSIDKENGCDLIFDRNTNAKMFFGNYRQILWAMYNKKILQTSFNIINEVNFSNDNFIELTLGAIVCNQGGIKFMNNIWGIRELSLKEHWGNRQKGITNNYYEKSIRSDFKLFKSNIDKLTCNGYADLVLKSYLKQSYLQKKKMVLKVILSKIIPKKLISLIKCSIMKKKSKLNLKNSYNHLPTVNLFSKDLLELKEIITILYKSV